MAELNNPNIGEEGKDTRFGAERGNPQAQNAGRSKPWSIRWAMRHLAAQKIDYTDKDAIKNLIGKRELTIAEAIALKSLTKAMGGDMRAIEHATDNVDGKVTQPIEMNPEKEDLPEFTSVEEAAAVYAEDMKR